MTGSGASVWKRLPSTQELFHASNLPLSNPSLGDSTAGSRLDYSISFATAGLKYAWVRVRSAESCQLRSTSGSMAFSLHTAAKAFQPLAPSEWVRTVWEALQIIG